MAAANNPPGPPPYAETIASTTPEAKPRPLRSKVQSFAPPPFQNGAFSNTAYSALLGVERVRPGLVGEDEIEK